MSETDSDDSLDDLQDDLEDLLMAQVVSQTVRSLRRASSPKRGAQRQIVNTGGAPAAFERAEGFLKGADRAFEEMFRMTKPVFHELVD